MLAPMLIWSLGDVPLCLMMCLALEDLNSGLVFATTRLQAMRGLSMPTFHIPPNLDMHYEVDDYTDPWRTPATVLMLHGNAESGAAWYGWVPHLAPWYRVVRPDMRGFGASTPMPRDFPWTLDLIIDDFCRLMDTLGVERFHLIGAKIGGHDRARLCGAAACTRAHADRGGDTDAVPRWRCGACASAHQGLRAAWGCRALGPGEHGPSPWEYVPITGCDLVDPIHGTHCGLDADQLHAHHRVR